MNIKPIIDAAACNQCWSAYFGVHADWCSHSTAETCVVCGRKYHQGPGDGRCAIDDYAHTKGFTTDTTTEQAA